MLTHELIYGRLALSAQRTNLAGLGPKTLHGYDLWKTYARLDEKIDNNGKLRVVFSHMDKNAV